MITGNFWFFESWSFAVDQGMTPRPLSARGIVLITVSDTRTKVKNPGEPKSRDSGNVLDQKKEKAKVDLTAFPFQTKMTNLVFANVTVL